MTKVNQTALKKLIAELSSNLTGETDLAADVILDTDSGDIYGVYFSPSVYSQPKCRLPPRTEDTPARHKICEVTAESPVTGIQIDDVSYPFTVEGFNSLIGRVIP